MSTCTGDHGRDARAAVPFPARVGDVDSRVEHGVDQAFVTRPSKAVAGPVQIDHDYRVNAGVA